MDQLVWNPEWNTGVQVIDDQHRQLLTQFDELLQAIRHHVNPPQVAPMLDFLAGYVETHFAEEENRMVATGYPGFMRHKSIHDDLRARVRTLIDGFHENPEVVTFEVVEFLTDWLLNHISVEDKLMARHLLHATGPSPGSDA